MSFLYFRDQVVLFVGDFVVFAAALWFTLVARHFEAPSAYELILHVGPFTFLIVLWLLVFVMVGLYDRHIALFEHRLASTVTEAQIINFLIAVAFFFLVPVRIQPQIVLILYFCISTLLIVIWRLGIFRSRFSSRACVPALVIGSGVDIKELVAEIQTNPGTHFECAELRETNTIQAEEIERFLLDRKITTLIVDPRLLNDLGTLRNDVRFEIIDASDLYEALFSRIPLTLMDREQLIRIAQSRESRVYDVLKRVMDIMIALMLGVVSLVVYPFTLIAIKMEDHGVLFVSQTRVGFRGKAFSMIKFRTMSGNDGGNYEGGKTRLTVTKTGNFLRKSRIDELPQLWSVLIGAQSLVGPRPELPPLVELYQKEIPNYDLRHLVQPGLSGWAQLYHQAHPHHGSDTEETRRKLSYDLYYIKHRSLILDLDIALKTLKVLALRLGA